MTDAFELAALSFTYRGRERPALSHIDLSLAPGRALALLGHSGAGKSTFLGVLSAVVPAVKKGELLGAARVFDKPLAGRRPGDLAGEVSCVFEDFDAALVATTVEAEVAFGPRCLGVPASEIGARVAAALETCGLADLRYRPVATLSGGQKQRLAVAAALAADARLYLFDEAATDLDPAGKAALNRIIGALAGQGRTVVAADNDGAGALALDEVALLADGALAARGAPEAILADEALCARAAVAPLPFLKYFERRGQGFRLRPDAHIAITEYTAEPKPPGRPYVVADGLGFSYPNGVAALEGFDISVGEGDFVAVVGANGGGKTTFAKVAAGLLRPKAGAVRLGGDAPGALPPRRRARLVGYLFQNPDHQIFQPTVADEVAFGPRHLGVAAAERDRRAAAAVTAVGLEGREDEDPFAMPKGDRQRVALASVLALEPAVLILDEPTTGLDRREVTALMDRVADLNRGGTTVLFITHAMDVVAAYARRVAVVAGGRVLAYGDTRDILRNEDLLARAGLEAPLAARLARQIGVDAVTADELYRALSGETGGRG